jgi:RNA polymerase sigma-70 factor (ECF subfamily)
VAIFRQPQSGQELQDQVAQLYIETREDVYRYLLTLGVHPPKAQEAVQEVFLRLYTSLKKGEKIESLRGWVFRVAHNYGLKVRARQSVEEKFDPAFETHLASPAVSAERDLLDREKMTRLNSAVESLSEQQKRVLFLRMEGLRYPQIASTLGISASAVGEFLRRALLRLRKVRDE